MCFCYPSAPASIACNPPSRPKSSKKPGMGSFSVSPHLTQNPGSLAGKKVFFETLGCQMNKSDSELMLGLLNQQGFELADSEKEADLLVINTCQIRGSAEDKAYSYLGRWKKLKRSRPDLKIAMTGCVSQQTKDGVFNRAPYVDIVIGTQNIHQLPDLVNQAFAGEHNLMAVDRQKDRNTFDYVSDITPRRESDILAWVSIIEGCDYFCTYCVVPYTRGRQISREPESILREVNELASMGFKEVTLLGQTVDAYGKDFKDREVKNKDYGLAELLYELNEIPQLERIRFMTSHPLDLSDKIIDAVASLPKVMEYIHIPMQSGDNTILERMRRGYTREEYFTLVDKLHERIPEVSISGDFIVGFPGETEEQFLRSLEAIERAQMVLVNVAAYSPRKQTPAGIWEERGEGAIPDEVKQDRLQRLNAEVKRIAESKNAQLLGQTVEVLVEGKSKRNESRLTGRTRNNKVVNFDSPFSEDALLGRCVNVKVLETTAWSLLGVHQDSPL